MSVVSSRAFTLLLARRRVTPALILSRGWKLSPHTVPAARQHTRGRGLRMVLSFSLDLASICPVKIGRSVSDV